MIIDKDFPNLINRGAHYEFDGDIISKGHLWVLVPLHVTGNITVDKCLKTEGSLVVSGVLRTGVSQ